jgi:NTP pyrophosphatase (non-canonical NTP hydrolase)
MSDLSIRQYQSLIDRWIEATGVRYFSELTNLGILMEEVGEVARIMTRVYGEQSFKRQAPTPFLADELADVLFVIGCIANQTGIDLTAAVRSNLEKKTVATIAATGTIPSCNRTAVNYRKHRHCRSIWSRSACLWHGA